MKIKPTNEPGSVLVALGPKERQLPESSGTRARLFNPKKILVPVDFSECSNKALQYALPFAKQSNASLVLLYVVQPYFPVPDITTVDWDLIHAGLREGGETQLAKLRESLEKAVKAETFVRTGNAAIEILKAAKELEIDLIILSTHGHTGLAHVFLSSTAERVVQRASCLVLVVREREHDFVGLSEATRRNEKIVNTIASLPML